MTFSQNWEIGLVLKNFFFVAACRTLENAILEKNISKHDIIQHKQITTEKYFFLYHKFGWDKE